MSFFRQGQPKTSTPKTALVTPDEKEQKYSLQPWISPFNCDQESSNDIASFSDKESLETFIWDKTKIPPFVRRFNFAFYIKSRDEFIIFATDGAYIYRLSDKVFLEVKQFPYAFNELEKAHQVDAQLSSGHILTVKFKIPPNEDTYLFSFNFLSYELIKPQDIFPRNTDVEYWNKQQLLQFISETLCATVSLRRFNIEQYTHAIYIKSLCQLIIISQYEIKIFVLGDKKITLVMEHEFNFDKKAEPFEKVHIARDYRILFLKYKITEDNFPGVILFDLMTKQYVIPHFPWSESVIISTLFPLQIAVRNLSGIRLYKIDFTNRRLVLVDSIRSPEEAHIKIFSFLANNIMYISNLSGLYNVNIYNRANGTTQCLREGLLLAGEDMISSFLSNDATQLSIGSTFQLMLNLCVSPSTELNEILAESLSMMSSDLVALVANYCNFVIIPHWDPRQLLSLSYPLQIRLITLSEQLRDEIEHCLLKSRAATKQIKLDAIKFVIKMLHDGKTPRESVALTLKKYPEATKGEKRNRTATLFRDIEEGKPVDASLVFGTAFTP